MTNVIRWWLRCHWQRRNSLFIVLVFASLIPDLLPFVSVFLRLFCQGAWLNIHFYHLYCISHDDLHIYDVRMSFIISFKLPHDTMWFSNTYYSHVIICVNKITMKILIIRSTCLNEHCLTAERRIFVISIITLPFIELRMCANRTVP